MKKIYLPIMLTSAAVFYITAGCAQLQAVPQMWVSKTNSVNRTNQFGTDGIFKPGVPSKKTILNGIIGKQSLGYLYTVGSFDALIKQVQEDNRKNNGNGVRLYFAAYNPKYKPKGIDMSSLVKKQLILIFAPSTGLHGMDVGTYYMIGPGNDNVNQIPAKIAKRWMRYFIRKEDTKKGLRQTVDPSDPMNKMDDGTLTDTRSIFYDTTNFIAFMQTERSFQLTQNKITIDHIQVNFAALTNDGAGAEGQWKDRMIVLYEFIVNEKIYYIDTAPGFCQRPNAPCSPTNVVTQGNKGGDNGQLCPPNCPCTTGNCN
jgi:hypothetical protein